ncbi:hypothetical protein ACA910_001853 [Epithemia clementina (nom. ined.)]
MRRTQSFCLLYRVKRLLLVSWAVTAGAGSVRWWSLTSLATLILFAEPVLADPDQDFLDAAFQNNIDGMKAALSQGANINVQDKASGQTALMGSVLRGNYDVVKYLLEGEHKNVVDITLPEKDGYTLAHGAAFQGRADIMKLLIQQGTINVKDDFHADGYAPVHRACWGRSDRHTATLRVLRDEAGFDIATMASRGGSVCAEMTRNPATMELLQEGLVTTEQEAATDEL